MWHEIKACLNWRPQLNLAESHRAGHPDSSPCKESCPHFSQCIVINGVRPPEGNSTDRILFPLIDERACGRIVANA